MMFTPSSHVVSNLLCVIFFSVLHAMGVKNNNIQFIKHKMVNTKQKSLSFFPAYTEMKALMLSQTTVGLIGQVPCNHEDDKYIKIDIIP